MKIECKCGALVNIDGRHTYKKGYCKKCFKKYIVLNQNIYPTSLHSFHTIQGEGVWDNEDHQTHNEFDMNTCTQCGQPTVGIDAPAWWNKVPIKLKGSADFSRIEWYMRKVEDYYYCDYGMHLITPQELLGHYYVCSDSPGYEPFFKDGYTIERWRSFRENKTSQR